MTLEMLGKEYLIGEDKLRKRIRVLNSIMKNLCGDELKEMQARIRSLYEMACLAKQTGIYLCKYYNESEEIKNVK